jgi:hypothetical protein
MEISRIRFAAAAKIAAAVVLAVTAVSNAQTTVFVPLPPCRIANTTAGGGPIASGTTRGFNVVGASFNYSAQGGNASGCGIPGFSAPSVPAVQAIAVNVVAVNPTGQGNLRAFPGNLALPNAATLNYQNFSDISHPYNIANGVIVPVNQTTTAGSINDLKVFASQTTDVVMDVTGYFTKVGGFAGNFIGPNNVQGATIGGGGNAGGPNSVTSNFATVGGGRNNNAGGDNDNLVGLSATVGGGEGNGAAADHATVAGGNGNLASGDNATVGGGNANQAVGAFSTVPGGTGNVAGALNSFAAGAVAKITDSSHIGAIIFSAADAGSSNFSSAASKEFAVRAAGGVRLRTSDDASTGCSIAANTSSLVCTSDRNAKTDFRPVDTIAVAAKVAAMPVETWRFRGEESAMRHMGPTAQDFHEAFALGTDDRTIGHLDSAGVALAAIQGLYKMLQQKEAEIRELRSRVNGLQSIADRVERLERQLPVRSASLDEAIP